MKSLLAALLGAVAVGSLAFVPVASAQATSTATTTESGGDRTPAAMADINPSGHVMVRGAVVTGVSGDIVTATTSWGSETLTWNVGIASTTTHLSGKSGRIALSDIKNGDRLSFSGPLDMTAGNLTVNAQNVRDMSASGAAAVLGTETSHPSGHRHLLVGKVTAINGSTVTVKEGKRTVMVNLGAGAKIEDRRFGTSTADSLQVGDHIRILGTLTGSSTIDASVLRDTSR